MHGNKRYMTVANFYIKILNGNIEDSIIITEYEKSTEIEADIICSAAF